MISVMAINQLLEGGERTMSSSFDWPASLVECMCVKKKKEEKCTCGMCASISAFLCQLYACTPLTQDSVIDYTDMSQHALA